VKKTKKKRSLGKDLQEVSLWRVREAKKGEISRKRSKGRQFVMGGKG
jgi:hypothetical protein